MLTLKMYQKKCRRQIQGQVSVARTRCGHLSAHFSRLKKLQVRDGIRGVVHETYSWCRPRLLVGA